MDERRIYLGAVSVAIAAAGAVVPFMGEPRCDEYATCQGIVDEFHTGLEHAGGTFVPHVIGWPSVVAGTTSSRG